MGSRRFDGILFSAYMDDHEPVHFHVSVGGGKLIVEIVEGHAIIAERKDAIKNVTRSDVRKALSVANREIAALITLWKEAHP